MSDSLYLHELNKSTPNVDNVKVVYGNKLIYPIDYQIESSCKIDLSPLSVEAIILNDSTQSCENCVDQIFYECSPLLEDVCDMIS